MDSKNLVAALPDAIVDFDESGDIRGWHGAAERMLGWSPDEAVGRDIHELLRPKLPGGEPAVLTRTKVAPGRAGGTDLPGASDGAKVSEPECELLVKAKDDSDVWVGLAYGSPLSSGGGSVHTVAVLRDIGHRKRVDIAKSDVISSVAHELRSPLTSIKGFAATLVRRWDRFDDDRRRQILATIESDADRVTRLIAELLDLSRIEEGRVQLRKQPVQVEVIAERVVDRLRGRSVAHSVELRFPHSFPSVMADPDKVEQVLTNLVENAVKYTEGGRVQIEGSVAGPVVRVAVNDEGSGIPHDHRQKVFRKFFRRAEVTPPQAPVPPGSGLGLYICKGLIEAHGGTIWVEDAPGGGSSFAFTLPLS